jgi:N-methylhydantoinase B
MRDPFLREIINNALTSIAEETAFFGTRTASETDAVTAHRELASGLFDADGRLIAQTRGSLIHVSAVYAMLPEVLKVYPTETLQPGDVIMSNDVFRGGIHPTDVAVFVPIFHEDEVAFFYGGMRIVSDLGGLSSSGLPANASECFHEGVLFPAVKLYRAGELNTDVTRIITANSRTGPRVLSEILAMAGAVNLAGARMLELVDKYTIPVLSEVIDQVLDYSERLARQAIERIPDGVYEGSYLMEEDGVEAGTTHLVKVRITVSGSDITMDFTGSSPQARGAINSTYSQSLSGCIFALRCYMEGDIPWNEGIYRPLTTILPPGSITNAQYPAATNVRMGTVQAMMDAIYQALSPVCPDHTVAPCTVPFTFALSGASSATEMFSFLDLCVGILGARASKDGLDGAPSNIYSTPAWFVEIEGSERQYPVRYLCASVFTDSGGPGRWRGGCGIVKEIEFLADGDLTVRAVDRYDMPPPGLAGGHAGRRGGWVLNRGRHDELRLPAKQTNIRVKAGDRLTAMVAGAGGYGDPLTRDPELVARDVRNRTVSPDGAERDYGVVIDDEGRVNIPATAELRLQRACDGVDILR